MNVVPQIFYDLIARIVPATCILIFTLLTIVLFAGGDEGAMISFFGSEEFKISNYLNLWTALCFIVLAYLLSLILKLPSEWLSELKMMRKLFFVKEQTVDLERYMEEKEKVNEHKPVPEPWKLFSIVRIKLPDEGYRLLKMLAEVRLCEMTFLGFLILAITNIILLFFSVHNLTERVILIVFFIFSTRSLLQLKYSIRNSYKKSVLMTWTQIGKGETALENG